MTETNIGRMDEVLPSIEERAPSEASSILSDPPHSSPVQPEQSFNNVDFMDDLDDMLKPDELQPDQDRLFQASLLDDEKKGSNSQNTESDTMKGIDSVHPEPAVPAKRFHRQASATNNKRRKALADPYDPRTVTTSMKSPLAEGINIKKLLSMPEAWSSLTPSQQLTVIKLSLRKSDMFVDARNEELSDTPVWQPHADLRYNKDFVHAASNWQEDLAQGRNDFEWKRQAVVAQEERKRGDFHDFKEKEREEYWGQKHHFKLD